MSRWMFVGVFGLFGCGPVIAEFSGGAEQGPDATVPGEDATDANEEPEVPPIQLVSYVDVGGETLEDLWMEPAGIRMDTPLHRFYLQHLRYRGMPMHSTLRPLTTVPKRRFYVPLREMRLPAHSRLWTPIQ